MTERRRRSTRERGGAGPDVRMDGDQLEKKGAAAGLHAQTSRHRLTDPNEEQTSTRCEETEDTSQRETCLLLSLTARSNLLQLTNICHS